MEGIRGCGAGDKRSGMRSVMRAILKMRMGMIVMKTWDGMTRFFDSILPPNICFFFSHLLLLLLLFPSPLLAKEFVGSTLP